MLKIATHNSATGEKPGNLLSWILLPFSRTQTKTIKEQYDAGCRMFDIRHKYHNGVLVGAHGLFTTKKTFDDILKEINNFPEKCYVSITYEGKINKNLINLYKFLIQYYKKTYTNITYGSICVKYENYKDIVVDWKEVIPADKWDNTRQGFIPLNGKTWQTFIPIPWLWKKIYYNKPKFDEEVFTYVDFL